MILRLAATLIAAIALVACGDTTERIALDAAPSELRVRVPVRLLLVRQVSLPTYAAAEELAFEDPSGVIQTSDLGLWADEPERATTLIVSRYLNTMTTATVAPEPWPLSEPPDSVVDIRVAHLLATNRGNLRLSGQYFLGGEEIEEDLTQGDDEAAPVRRYPRRTLRSSSELFDIHVPIPTRTAQGLSNAQSQALKILAETIARDLAR